MNIGRWLPVILIVSAIVVVLATIVGAVWAYVDIGGFSNEFSHDNQDWGAFGSYLGGVLGAVAGLTSVLILSVTLLQQQSLIERQFKNELKQDILRLIDKIEAKIETLLQYEFASQDGETMMLQEVVQGMKPIPESGNPTYSRMVIRLVRLSGEYAESLMFYRESIDPFYVYRFHKTALKEIHAFLEKNTKYMGQWDQVSFGMLTHLTNEL